MLVFWKAKLILFAVPKTGTTALEAALAPYADVAIVNPPGLKHCNVQKYEREVMRFIERGQRHFKRVALIREPVDWLGSWYRYRSRPEISGREKAIPPEVTFEDFVREWLRQTPPAYAALGSQGRFLTTKSGELGVDHLFRYENMSTVISFLEEQLAQKIILSKENVSPEGPTHLSQELHDQVRASHSRDFTYWEAAKG